MDIRIFEDHITEISADADAIKLTLEGIAENEDAFARCHISIVLVEHLLEHVNRIKEKLKDELERSAK